MDFYTVLPGFPIFPERTVGMPAMGSPWPAVYLPRRGADSRGRLILVIHDRFEFGRFQQLNSQFLGFPALLGRDDIAHS